VSALIIIDPRKVAFGSKLRLYMGSLGQGFQKLELSFANALTGLVRDFRNNQRNIR